MKIKPVVVGTVALLVGSTSALAVYTRTTSNPVHIQSIYANEFGSPFINFSATVNSVCSGGNGLYLHDISGSSGNNAELRRNKMAMALAAKLAQKRVVLDYFYDPARSGWEACYIQGIQIVD